MADFKIQPIHEEDFEYVSLVMQKRWGLSPLEAEKETRRYLADDEIAAGFCAHCDGRTVGVGLFDRFNTEISKEYSPWLLLLWVEPEFRGNDIGIMLTQARMNHARRHGYNEVFIDTNDALDYHLKLGWEKVIPALWNSEPVWILRFDLSKSFPAR